jgi:predicted phage-related endonuclease
VVSRAEITLFRHNAVGLSNSPNEGRPVMAMVVTEDPSPMSPEQKLEADRWHREHVTQEDILGIVGRSNVVSALGVWMRKASRRELLGQEDAHWLELGIAPEFEKRTGLKVSDARGRVDIPGTCYGATIEGYVINGGGDRAVFDITTAAEWVIWRSLPIPLQYLMQWQMFVAELDEAWLCVISGHRLHIHHMRRCDDTIRFLSDEADRFEKNHMLPNVAPSHMYRFDVEDRMITAGLEFKFAERTLIEMTPSEPTLNVGQLR